MHYQQNIISVVLVGLLACSSSFAGVLSSMEKRLDGSGIKVQLTSPYFYKLRGGHYAHGGSLVMRNSVKNIQPIKLEPPSLSAGDCGGLNLHSSGSLQSLQTKNRPKHILPIKLDPPSISSSGDLDSHVGGFQVISKEELISALKNTPAASRYAFILALQTVAPTMKNVLVQMKRWKEQVKKASVHSGYFGQQMIKGKVSSNELAELSNDDTVEAHREKIKRWLNDLRVKASSLSVCPSCMESAKSTSVEEDVKA